MRAASNITESTSKGSTQLRNTALPTLSADPAATGSIFSLPKATTTPVPRISASTRATSAANGLRPVVSPGSGFVGALVSIIAKSTRTTIAPT